MGDRLTDMRVFSRVARLESFSRASRELRVSSTAVSRRVGELESELGVKLLHRTTRQITLTAVGRAYLERAERILAELDDLEDRVRQEESSPRGVLRVAAGVSFAQEQLAPLIPELLERCPELTVELDLGDRVVDLVSDGIDVAVRIGPLQDSSLVVRKLATSRLALVASDAYLERYGTPASIDSLESHHCLIDRNQPRTWRFHSDGGLVTFEPSSRYRANSAHAVLEAAAGGVGIGLVPTFVSGPAILSGRVRAILRNFEPEPVELNALYLESRHLSTRVRVFIDYLREKFGDPPCWDRWREAL